MFSVICPPGVLGVDRVDVMQIHSSGVIERGGFEAAMKIRAELVRGVPLLALRKQVTWTGHSLLGDYPR